MRSLFGYALVLVLAFSGVAQAEVRVRTLSNGTTELSIKDGFISMLPLYFYKWFRNGTRNTAKDDRGPMLRGKNYYLNSYPSTHDEMSYDQSAKFVFDGKENQIQVDGRRITIQGKFAYLLAKGGSMDAAADRGASTAPGRYYGDFQVQATGTNLLCEVVTIPVSDEDRLVHTVSRCIFEY